MKCIINIIERALDEWDFMDMIFFKDPRRGTYWILSYVCHSKLISNFKYIFSELASIINILFTLKTSIEWSLHLGVIIIGNTTLHEKEIYILKHVHEGQ
jgi:hypothetical protein